MRNVKETEKKVDSDTRSFKLSISLKNSEFPSLIHICKDI